MARRSLKASTAGIEKAKRAFRMRQWTQEYLASEVGLETRQPVWKFFTGKPIERQSFMEICFQLGLDWQEIAELPTPSLLTDKKQEWDYCRYVDSLVQMVRSRRSDKIQVQCATMRLLDIAQPTQLEEIFVSVNVLNQISSQRWLDIFELQNLAPEEFERCDLSSRQQISAMQAAAIHSKVLVLGKPGSGKTTLVQHIATQCDRGKFLADHIPIFIRLKNFAEDARETGDFSLVNYTSQELGKFGISDQQIEILLAHGRVLFLLDGLDEISEDDSVKVVKKIGDLSEEYYKNRFIITCRVATWQYRFEGFTDIEIADFDSVQIEAFAQKWFLNVAKNSSEKAKELAGQFVQKLHKAENRQIRELAGTPLLLNLACCVFQARSDFPTRRIELYQQALDVLLHRWDRVKRIKPHEDYSLSLPHQIDLLSHIAAIAFKQDRYFFSQTNLQQYIIDYLCKSPTSLADLEVLQLKSEAVLKSLSTRGILVERARGIYSFSHLTFQEYLTARNVVASPDTQLLEHKLSEAVRHLTEPRWRKVLLLTAGMLGRNVTNLLDLMQQHVDALVTADEQSQEFFSWLNQKALSVQAPYQPAAIRAFYLTLVLEGDPSLTDNLTLAFAIDPRLASHLAPDLAIDLALNHALSLLSQAFPLDSALDRVLALNFAPLDDQNLACDLEIQQVLQHLKEQIPPLARKEAMKKLYNANGGQTGAEKLRSVMVRCRNIGHQWQFSDRTKEVLKQYYTANQLLVDCLKSECEVSPIMREKILQTLLLPVPKTSDRTIDSYMNNCA